MAYTSEFIEVQNRTGLKICLSTLGAGVRSLSLNGQRLILEMKEETRYLDSPQFFGKTLGRVAGRIPYDKVVEGKKLSLPQNEKGVCLHGGVFQGFSYKNFDVSQSENDDSYIVDFSYLSPDGETGFNGNLITHVIYEIRKDENVFFIRFKASCDQDTIVSLSNHIYWNLDGKDVNDYKLTVHAHNTGEYRNGSLLILGEEKEVPELDFNDGPRLKEKLDAIDEVNTIHNLDHLFFFDEKQTERPQVILENDKTRIECYTSYGCANIYCDNTKSDTDFNNGDDFNGLDRRAIAIEPQKFCYGDNALLKKDETYDEYIMYRITEKRD